MTTGRAYEFNLAWLHSKTLVVARMGRGGGQAARFAVVGGARVGRGVSWATA